MVRTLVAMALGVVAMLRPQRVPLAELAGGTAGVIGLVLWLGAPAGWISVSIALLAKSAEWDVAARRGNGDGGAGRNLHRPDLP